ncbi:hypothetical protein [Radicibacter daui]|uniref:hypothetical protein n=1 Tax=Radicibacter daui TaxID=3064829 RepID=UPI0040469D94
MLSAIAAGASAQDKAATDAGGNGSYLIIPKLSPCQKAYGEGYQLYWQARNRAAVLVSNRQISVDSYVSMMSSLNGLWRPYVGRMGKLNAADANSPDCASTTQTLVSELGGHLSQMPDPGQLSGSSPGVPAPGALAPPPPVPPPPPGG